MKKFLTFVLVLAMVLSVSSFAMAADALPTADSDGKITLNSETYTLSGDITLTAGQYIEVPADVTAVLDIGGILTGTPSEAKAYAVIVNKGTLTIKGSGTVLCTSTIAGSTSYALNTITNSGNLTIDGATIENKFEGSGLQIGYAIDNNSTTGDAIVNVESGSVIATGSDYYDGIRQFCNSQTNRNEVNVSDGTVSSIWMQNPSDGSAGKNTKDMKGRLSVTGGTVTNWIQLEPSTSFSAEICGGDIESVDYFQSDSTNTDRNLTNVISGGTFSEAPADDLIADDAVAAEISSTDASGNSSTVYAVGKKAIEEAAEEADGDVTVTITQTSSDSDENALTMPEGTKVVVEDPTANLPTPPASDDPNQSQTTPSVTVNGTTVNAGEEYTVPVTQNTTKPSSGSGISVKYNGGNSFSTSNPAVPTGVEIDGVPVTFNGTGSNFSVGCISSDAKWVTVRWNSTSVTTNFTPDGLVECTTVSIPKTGDMSFWAAVAAFFGF